MKIRIVILSCIAALVAMQNVRADVAVSNLGEASTNGDGWSVSFGQWVAMGFTVGTNSPTWTLESVSLDVWLSGPQGNDFTVGLYADNGGLPGTLLASFSGASPTNTVAGTVHDYIPTATTLLSAGVSYWLRASSLSGGYSWTDTDPYSAADTGVNGWSIDNGMANSLDQGATWNYYPGDEPALFAINVAAVPEPATLALTGLGALGLWMMRRRQ